MKMIPKAHPPPFYFDHPGTFLRRSWISRPLGTYPIVQPWVLSLRPYRQPTARLPVSPPPAAAPNTPAMNRLWFQLYMRSHVDGIMEDGQAPCNGNVVDRTWWNTACTRWNLIGGYDGQQFHSGQQFFMHLNMLGPPYGGPNWSAPPVPPPLLGGTSVRSVQVSDATHVLVTFWDPVTVPAFSFTVLNVSQGISQVNPVALVAQTTYLLPTSTTWLLGQMWSTGANAAAVPPLQAVTGTVLS